MKLLLFILFSCIFSPILGQIVPAQQIEQLIDTKHGSNYHVLPLQESGVITLLESQDLLKGNKRAIQIVKYDTTLQKLWESQVLLKYEHILKLYTHDATFLYLLIEKKSTAFEIAEVELATGNARIIEIEDIIPLEITHFKVLNKVLFIGGEINSRPAILWFAYEQDKKPKVLPQINTLKASLQEITFSKDQTCVSVLLTTSKSNQPNLFVQNYTLDGHLLSKWATLPDKQYGLLTFRPYILSATEQLLFGTYAKKGSDAAQGFYVARCSESAIENIKFYDFSNYRNVFNYLPTTRKEKLFEKINKKRQKGKVYSFDHNFLVSPLIERVDKLLLFGDSYLRATVQNSSVANPSFAGLPTTNTRRPNLTAIGGRNNFSYIYKYQNFVAVAFDKTGNLLWDNTFTYKDRDSYSLQPQAHWAMRGDSLTLLQVDDEYFLAQKTANSLPTENIDQSKTDTLFTEAKPIDEVNPEVQTWYEDYFIASGMQRLKTFDVQKGIEYKEIFYLTKIYYRSRKKK